MSLQFEHKEFIWLFTLLPVLFLLFLLLYRWKKATGRKIGDKQLVNLLIEGYSSKLFNTKFIITSVAFVAGILAVMNLREPGERSAENRVGIDVAIALDVSNSMLATDVAPSRLDRAKQFITKLMDAMPDDRIALIVFAGKAYLQMPLTNDHGAAALFVASAAPGIVPQQGTDISDALEMSANAFNNIDEHYKSVVMISDGENHNENAIATAKKLAEQGVMINTVGIGSPEGTTIIDPATGLEKKDENGNAVVSKLNEEVLKQVAEATNGTYTHLQSSDDAIKVVLSQLSQIERKAFGDVSQMNFNTYYYLFAGLMFLLLIIELFIPEVKRILS